MIAEVSAAHRVQIRVGLLQLDAVIALVDVLRVIVDVLRVMDYVKVLAQMDALLDVIQVVQTHVNQMYLVEALFLLVTVLARHVHLIVMGRAETIVLVLIFQQVHLQKIQDHHVQNVVLHVALTVIKYAQGAMVVVVVNV